MRKIYLIFCIVFLGLLLTLGITSIVMQDESFSELENRQLMTKEDLSDDVMSGSFQSDLEELLSDQFPFRYLCVTLQTKIKLVSGKKDIGGAYIGKDRLFQKITEPDVSINDISSHAAKYAGIGERAGVKVTAMPVPSAGCVFPELLPDGAEMYDFDLVMSRISDNLGAENIIDVSDYLSDDSENYYRTDHHWTESGASKAYLAFCEYHGLTGDKVTLPPAKTVSENFLGTLYSKVPGIKTEYDILSIPDIPFSPEVTADGKEVSFYDYDALETRDKYRVFLGGNHGITVIDNPDASEDGTLLIIKDSFANSLVPYLVSYYKKIVMIDERYTMLDIASLAVSEGADEILIIKEAAFF